LNQYFIQHKEKLQVEVSTFIKRSTDIMKDWAHVYIKLLTSECCLKILNEALQILNGLASFYADLIGTPNWPSANNKELLTLFLLKLYLSSTIIQPTELVEYLETPGSYMLLIGTKLLMETETDDKAQNIISSLNLSEFD
jgi:hypothetical protein